MTTTTLAPQTSFTAVRTRRGAKATVTVYADGVEINRAGGARADRAQAILMAMWDGDEQPRLYGVRGDAIAAQTEAHRLATATSMRHGGMTFAIRPALWAVAVLVTDEAA